MLIRLEQKLNTFILHHMDTIETQTGNQLGNRKNLCGILNYLIYKENIKPII